MARSQFSYTAVAADIANTAGIGAPIKALENVEYNVYKVDSSGNRITTLAQRPATYAARTSNTDLGYSGTTDADGVISFWLDPGEYEIEIEDTQAPARISTRTITWSSLAAADGSISGDYVSNDSQLDLPTLGDDILRQLVPIGTVLDWWRPSGSNASVPSGFVICDGSQYASNQHDFPGGGTINVPDLRNKFILGASISATGNGTTGNTATNAPGIGGAGGSNASINLAHTHTIPGHGHSHNISTQGESANISVLDKAAFKTQDPLSSSSGNSTTLNHTHDYWEISWTTGTASSGSLGRIGSITTSSTATYGANSSLVHNHMVPQHGHGISQTDHSHAISGTVGPNTNGDSALTTNAITWTSEVTDVRPAYFGLLKIMKIKRS